MNSKTQDVKSFSHSFTYQAGRKRFRIPFLEREKAAYLILRRKGLSYNTIAECFGRSVSVVYNSIKRAASRSYNVEGYWNVRRKYGFDLRKLPYAIRMRMASFRRYKLFKLLSAWESWICGEEEKPP